MRSPATTSWTWRPRPMFASALTSRSTPLWRSACSTRSRPRCQSPERRSRRRNGRHPCLPGLRRLRWRSPALAPSPARLISGRDPAVLGLRVAVGDRALDELTGEPAGPFQQVPTAWMAADTVRVPIYCRRTGLEAGWTVFRSSRGQGAACAERLTAWQASGGVGGQAHRAATVARPAQRPDSSPQRSATRRALRPTLAAIIS